MTEVVAALIWDQDKFMICQRPANKARGLLWYLKHLGQILYVIRMINDRIGLYSLLK